MADQRLPTDGPTAILGRLVRLLHLPYSKGFIERAVVAHPKPDTLLALVEIGALLGLKATPGQTDPGSLDAIELPAVVHFSGPETEAGFGVLEAVSPESFRVWDKTNGSQMLDRDLFLAHWSGIVVLVERAEKRGVREKGQLRSRAADVVWGSWDPIAITGGRGAASLRGATGLVGAVLLGLAVLARPSSERIFDLGLVLLTLLGLAVSSLTTAAVGRPTSLGARLCARGGLVDCQSVLTSRYARIFGIPLSDIGIAFFGTVLLLIAGTAGTSRDAAWFVIGIAYAITLPLSLMLLGVQVSMRKLCKFCMVVHGVNLSCAVIAWMIVRDLAPTSTSLAAHSLLAALYFSLLLFFVVPYFHKSQGLGFISGRLRRISASPFGSLADLLTETPSGITGPECGLALAGPGAEHTIVVFAHPSCGKCESVLREVGVLAFNGIARVYVTIAPKDPEESERLACTALLAAALAAGPERVFETYMAAKKGFGKVTQDPIRVLSDALALETREIEGRLEHARSLVDRAEELADIHVEGTPWVFFDSRSFPGPVPHLAFLLQNHPGLLEPLKASGRARPDAKGPAS